jgi:hypothetical protein
MQFNKIANNGNQRSAANKNVFVVVRIVSLYLRCMYFSPAELHRSTTPSLSNILIASNFNLAKLQIKTDE